MKSGRTKHISGRRSKRSSGRLEWHDEIDYATEIKLDTDDEVDDLFSAAKRKDAAATLLAEIERAEDAAFMGFSARGRDEYFDGQYRIKLVD